MPNRTSSDSLIRLSTALVNWRTLRGDGFSTGQLFTGVGAGNQKQLYIENPNEKYHYAIANINISSTSKRTWYKSFNVTEDTQGNNPDTGVQSRISHSYDSNAVVRTGGNNETGAYSGGRQLNKKVVGANGNAVRNVPGAAGEGPVSNSIKPNENMCLFVTNNSTDTADMSIGIDWVEIPVGQYPYMRQGVNQTFQE